MRDTVTAAVTASDRDDAIVKIKKVLSIWTGSDTESLPVDTVLDVTVDTDETKSLDGTIINEAVMFHVTATLKLRDG